jgi:hypothetical protein
VPKKDSDIEYWKYIEVMYGPFAKETKEIYIEQFFSVERNLFNMEI